MGFNFKRVPLSEEVAGSAQHIFVLHGLVNKLSLHSLLKLVHFFFQLVLELSTVVLDLFEHLLGSVEFALQVLDVDHLFIDCLLKFSVALM